MQSQPLRQLLLLLAFLLTLAASPSVAQPPGQSGGRGPSDFMRRMDANQNGSLEPNEISDRARPFLERYARMARLDMSRPMPISSLERARSIYYSQGGAGATANSVAGAPGSLDSIPDFAPLGDEQRVPGFGLDAELMADVMKEDLDRAASRLSEQDRNRDGFLDRRETAEGRWTDDPFRYDANRDNRLTVQELAQRYTQRRVNEARAARAAAAAPPRPASGGRGEGGDRYRREEGFSRRFGFEGRSGSGSRGNRSLWFLASNVMGRYDANRDGALSAAEWQAAGIESSNSDRDQDGVVSRDELVGWLSQQWAEAAPLPQGLPDWFAACDVDKDGQVRMAEFARDWTDDKVSEFAKYDRDGDGIVTTQECVGLAMLIHGAHVNNKPQMILPRTVVSSEIDVASEAIISHLAVQLSITHSQDDELDAFLIGPDGQRVELFTRVGGDGDHFDNTILDDTAGAPINRANAPFKGTFRPESADNSGQPSLKSFNGKPIRGVWRLEVRADRSDRIGMLHAWSLIVRRGGSEGQPAPAAVPSQGSPPPDGGPPGGGPPGPGFRRWRRGGDRER